MTNITEKKNIVNIINDDLLDLVVKKTAVKLNNALYDDLSTHFTEVTYVLTQKCQNKSCMPLLTSLLIKSIIYIFFKCIKCS